MMGSAFGWHIYDDRRKALEHLKETATLVDTIIETEDGRAHAPVHYQVMSAFGDKLTQFIQDNGKVIVNSTNAQSTPNVIDKRQRPTNGPGPVALAAAAAAATATSAPPVGPPPSVLLTSSKTNKPLKLVRLPKVNRYTLSILVECAYTGYIRTDLASGGVWQVLEMADYYEMADVIRACCSFLTKNLNQSNCIYFYHVGIKHKHPLQRSAWHQIRANFKQILEQNLLRSSRELVENGVLGPNWQGQLTDSSANSSSSTAQSAPQSERSIAPSTSAATQTTTTSTTTTTTTTTDVVTAVATATAVVLSTRQQRAEIEASIKANNLATIKFEHFEPLLMHDKLNIDNEESIWYAIKLWCTYDLKARTALVANLLPCMRFPRFRSGTEFISRQIWHDPLIINNQSAQHQLAVLDRNHRGYLGTFANAPLVSSLSSPADLRNPFSSVAASAAASSRMLRDGFNMPCAIQPRQLRPRIPQSVLLAIGGWQQGQPTTLIESYDVNCNLWFESRNRISSPLAYHGIEYINNLLYICGGTDGNDILNALFTFDPIRGDCRPKPPMRDARCYVSTAHLGDYLYALGGHNGAQRMRSVERFNLRTEQWAHVHDMNVARSDASACVHSNTIYIAGGLNDQVVESSVEFYNQCDNTWTFIQSMSVQRTSFTLLAYGASLLAVGGNNGAERLNSVEQFNFQLGTWAQHSQMRYKRSTFSAALVDGNKLIVVGGYNGTTPFSQVEMFDEHLRQWVVLQKIRYDRSGLKVVVVQDLPNASEYTFLGSPAAILAAGGQQYSIGTSAIGSALGNCSTTTTTTTTSNRNPGSATQSEFD